MVLSILRGLVVFLIGFLILDPSLRWLKQEEEKPLVLFFQDNSSSVLYNTPQSYYKKEYPEKISSLLKEISEKYEVRSYSFGKNYSEGLPFSFQDDATDMSPLLQKVKDQFEGRNIGAIILATDGIFNRGENPAAEILRLHVPVYSIGLGDTSVQKDLILNQVDFNDIVFSGDSFPIQASVTAHNLDGKDIIAYLKQGNQILDKKVIRVKGPDAHFFIPFFRTESKPGNYPFKVELESPSGESNSRNNVKSLLVHVLKSQQNILLLTSISHPDISAIKQALQNSHNKVSVHFTNEKDFGNIDSYSCLILYQIPSVHGEKLEPDLSRKLKNLPVLRIAGLQTRASNSDGDLGNLPFFSRMVPIQSRVDILNTNFQFFTLKDSLKDLIPGFPPLDCPFSINQFYSPEKVLVNSVKAGTLDQNKSPLILLDDRGDHKNAWILGEGIWKWRTYEFAKTGHHNLVDDLLAKIISFLTVVEDKSRFRIMSPKTIWEENEPINLEAEVYNKNFELVNNASVRINLKSREGKNYSFNFSPDGKKYSLKMGSLPVGNYSYSAKVIGIRIPDSIKSGLIQIEPSLLEGSNTQADFRSLIQMAKESSGEFLLPGQIENLKTKILNNPIIKPIIHERKGFTSWIDLPVFLGLLLVLISAEWVLRKWNGFY